MPTPYALDSYVSQGETITLGNIQVYSTKPPTSTPCKGRLLLLPDGFGLARHNFILADRFAKAGWHAMVPDYFEGDALPIQMLRRDQSLSIDDQPGWSEADKQTLRDLDFPVWLKRHNAARVTQLLTDLVAELERESSPIVGVGYCFGGKYVLRLAKLLAGNQLKAAAAFHPSFVEAEDMAGVRAPLYVGLAEKDTMVPASLPDDLQTWWAAAASSNMPAADTQFTMEIYPGVGHGFAARPDTKDEVIREQYERAFQRTVEHFNKVVGN